MFTVRRGLSRIRIAGTKYSEGVWSRDVGGFSFSNEVLSGCNLFSCNLPLREMSLV
jgi:hypothetical protein